MEIHGGEEIDQFAEESGPDLRTPLGARQDSTERRVLLFDEAIAPSMRMPMSACFALLCRTCQRASAGTQATFAIV